MTTLCIPQSLKCNNSKSTFPFDLTFATVMQYQKLDPKMINYIIRTQKIFVMTLCIPQSLKCNNSKSTPFDLAFATVMQYQKLDPKMINYFIRTQKIFVMTLCSPQSLKCKNKTLSDCSKTLHILCAISM